MPMYITLFTYASESWEAMVQRPEDREEVARSVMSSVGGELHAFYWMLGEDDGVAIYEAPSASAAAAVSAAISATGRLSRLRTSALLTAKEAHAALELANVVSGTYRPPGRLEEWRSGYDQLG